MDEQILQKIENKLDKILEKIGEFDRHQVYVNEKLKDLDKFKTDMENELDKSEIKSIKNKLIEYEKKIKEFDNFKIKVVTIYSVINVLIVLFAFLKDYILK